MFQTILNRPGERAAVQALLVGASLVAAGSVVLPLPFPERPPVANAQQGSRHLFGA
jgi:hypothetical protein